MSVDKYSESAETPGCVLVEVHLHERPVSEAGAVTVTAGPVVSTVQSRSKLAADVARQVGRCSDDLVVTVSQATQ